ncbi:GH25 family lysozyme [Streptomyces sp. NPDC088785]|uniref:GH25 family lysozyme n=1 Tax=Streptomyces sp. NPDC088785 TaxID=3365897 RepID=UPI00380A493D
MVRGTTPSSGRRARLRAAASVAALALGASLLAALPARAVERPKGHDVSSHQRNVDWPKTKSAGAQFTYVKATESTTYTNPYFAQQYGGAADAGLLRGAYHFAIPSKSSGAAQAAFFVRNGGTWRGDGRTLPPALDIEYNPYGADKCYGMSASKLVAWISAFSDELLRLTGRRPVLYTTYNWWKTCTGDSRVFAADHALWLAHFGAGAGALPGGWSYWTFWQYADSGGLPGDQDLFNGSAAQLKSFARG